MKFVLLAGAAWSLVLPIEPGASPAPAAVQPPVAAAAPSSADLFQYPLPEWAPNCLGFGSEWRYCNGTPLRSCPGGAVWLHTGVDITTGIQPVMAAGDGVIIGYLIDPQFRGGVLIRHQTSAGVVITQYWHVWLRSGFGAGSTVKRGQIFADVADMGSRTHLHFAVFNGDYDSHAWNGALPPAACSGFPAFPYRFVQPNAFIEAHLPPERFARGIRI
jgi:murein DD-endopeptidase MepM/ murein hydrolase activator NlpD